MDDFELVYDNGLPCDVSVTDKQLMVLDNRLMDINEPDNSASESSSHEVFEPSFDHGNLKRGSGRKNAPNLEYKKQAVAFRESGKKSEYEESENLGPVDFRDDAFIYNHAHNWCQRKAVSPLFIVMKNVTGYTFDPQVLQDFFTALNILVTASSSNKMKKEHLKMWLEELFTACW
ncbi:hypothetical protein BV898_02836 [Hypsibius exemplaris]|uniref:Uncharacterized protein n=1 Tax=Hypsibius exemplaris TaxID=2072580 RepID=A0A1W0X7N3_HYPEX|nr:hypothetical protein BV898_02836 [Hypsibius exemplaris]